MSQLGLSHRRRYERYFKNLKFTPTKKAKTYSGIVFSLFAIAFFAIFAIKPTLVIIFRLAKEIKDQKEVNLVLEEKIKDLSKAQAQYNRISGDLYLIDQSLPPKPEVPLLIKELEALSRISSVQLTSFKIDQILLEGDLDQKTDQKQIKPANNKAVRFTAVVSGDYQSLRNFLHSLDNLRRIILVESFSFKSGKSQEEKLNLLLEARAYFLPEEK